MRTTRGMLVVALVIREERSNAPYLYYFYYYYSYCYYYYYYNHPFSLCYYSS